jgi:pimeloyl-ACP methyl ester carboxylesterase
LIELESLWYGPSPDVAPTLVFLHEGLGSASAWRSFPRHLAEKTGCGALVYSRSGYGSSPPAELPRPIAYMHDEAAILDDVLADHGVREAILVGHSDGASIALIYAGRTHSGRLQSLILEAPHVFAERIGIDSIAAMKVAYETTDLRQRLGRYHTNVDNAFRGWNDVWLDPRFRAWNIEEFLPAITVPALLIQGTGDEYGTWKQINAIERQVRGPVETLRVPGAGHAPHRDQPELVLDRMSAFVSPMLQQARRG